MALDTAGMVIIGVGLMVLLSRIINLYATKTKTQVCVCVTIAPM
jgi:hypothetical protein